MVTTKQSRIKALQLVAKKYYQLDLDEPHILQFWGQPFEEFMLNVFKHRDSYENIQKNYLEIIDQFPMEAYPGAVETLTELAEAYLVGIVTACGREVAMLDLERLGFPVDRLFDIQTAEDSEFHKPDPKVFDPILEKLQGKGVKKEEVLYIGDGLNDYKAANGAGLAFLGIIHHADSKVFDNTEVKTIHSFKEIEEYIGD